MGSQQKTQKNIRKVFVFKLFTFLRTHIKKQRNGVQFAFSPKMFHRDVPFSPKTFHRDVPPAKVNKKHKKASEMSFFSTCFHFYACTSKNGEMACNFRFSPKMFHRDVP